MMNDKKQKGGGGEREILIVDCVQAIRYSCRNVSGATADCESLVGFWSENSFPFCVPAVCFVGLYEKERLVVMARTTESADCDNTCCVQKVIEG